MIEFNSTMCWILLIMFIAILSIVIYYYENEIKKYKSKLNGLYGKLSNEYILKTEYKIENYNIKRDYYREQCYTKNINELDLEACYEFAKYLYENKLYKKWNTYDLIEQKQILEYNFKYLKEK